MADGEEVGLVSEALGTQPPRLPLAGMETDAEAGELQQDASPKAAGTAWRWAPLAVLVVVAFAAGTTVSLFLGHSQPDEMPVAGEQGIQDEALIRCHAGCHDRDRANMQCLKDCIPAKQRCMDVRCAGADSGSAEFTACAIDCHTTECDAGCAGFGEIASRCHTNCEPNRNLLLDKPCIDDCKTKYDDSCMAGCSDSNSKCVGQKCKAMSGEALLDCQYQCTVESCGAECQETAQAFSTCSSHCYPQPPGQPDLFQPTSVRSANVAARRKKSCHKRCSEFDNRHSKCMHLCGPKISACMHRICPSESPGTIEQAQCQKECEAESCGAECQQTSAEVDACYEECQPADKTQCNQDCKAHHDDSCMKDCSQSMATCLVESCAELLGKGAYSECQETCTQTHCGQDCADKAKGFMQCAASCTEEAME